MRLFTLSNFQDIVIYFFPTLVFMILFGVGLAYARFRVRGPEDEERENRIIYHFPAGIKDRDVGMPLVMTLIIVGTVIWAFFYILLHGLLGVKI
jgi:hypothetical protein